MSSFTLRLIALITMLLDHIGFAFYADMPEALYTSLRLVGRLSMPLFCFLIAEGLFHTKSVKHYLLRLLLLAIISEIPFDLVFSRTVWNPASQNVFITLFAGLLAIMMFDFFAARGQKFPALLALTACAAAAWALNSDYSFFGVYFVFVFYAGRGRMRQIAPTFALGVLALAASQYLDASSRSFAVLTLMELGALPLIWKYNGRKGGPKDAVTPDGGRRKTALGSAVQWAAYAFYPVHLLILWALEK